MHLTKLEHACLDIKEGTDRLIIDPGEYSSSLTDFSNVTALVITHVHPDHFDQAKITKLVEQNHDLKIFTTQEVADEIKAVEVTVPIVGKPYQVGAFKLEFFGGQHAVIAPSYPVAQNYGVLVNDKFYYPGDTSLDCPKPYSVLATPTMAPWLKVSDSFELISKSSATTIFPTHNGFINHDGQDLYSRLFGMAAEQTKKKYQFLAPGESLEI